MRFVPDTRALVGAAIAAWATGFTALSILRHEAFATGRFDMGNMVQAVWATAHGHPLATTDLRGDQVSRLASHVDPILVLLGPLWWIWPSVDMLVAVQAAAVSLGAVPVYRLARRHLGSVHAAAGLALAYLVYPALGWLTLNEFHPVALATPLLLFAFDALDRDRLVPFALFAVAASACKEEIALVVAGFGLWYAFARGRWRAGGVIVTAGVVWTAIAVGVILPHFNDGSGSGFFARYEEAGGSPGGILRNAVTHPLRLVDLATTRADLEYVLALVLPLAGLCLLAPLVLVAAVPELALNLLSATPTQTSIHFHYTAGLIPVITIASVFGAARLARRLRGRAAAIAGVALVAALIGAYRLGPLPFWHDVPGGSTFQATAARVTEHDRVAERALRLIPDGAVVSASNALGAHLSARRRVLSFPFLQDATWVAADETQPGYADRLAPVPHALQLAWLRGNPAWRLVFEQDGVLVFRRVRRA